MILQSDEAAWASARCGCVTASRIADILAKTKSGPSASRANYCAELVVERLTGAPYPSCVSAAMQHGLDTEAEARAAYAFHHDAVIEPAALIFHPSLAKAAATPDGFIGEDGLVEFKCPLPATHIATLLGRSVSGAYVNQVQFQMSCTGRAWCDWVSYDPRMPEDMRLFVKRIPRNDDMIREVDLAVEVFLGEVDEMVARLQRMYRGDGGELRAALLATLEEA